jgi:hypothetical protein
MKSLSVVGGARALIHHQEDLFTFSIGLCCALGRRDRQINALFDTGAAWSVVGGDLLHILLPYMSPCGSTEKLSTRLGTFVGVPHRIPLHFLADQELGQDLEIDATFLVIEDWPGPVILGFNGCLEHIVFAYEPRAKTHESFLWWGLPEDALYS